MKKILGSVLILLAALSVAALHAGKERGGEE